MTQLTAKEQQRLDQLLAKQGADLSTADIQRLMEERARQAADLAPAVQHGPAVAPLPADPPAATQADVQALAEAYSRLNREQRREADRQAADEGFVQPRKLFRLKFEEPEMAGLVVRAKSIGIGGYLDLTSLAKLADKGSQKFTEEDAQDIRELFDTFAQALVSWNLREPVYDDDGEEVIGDNGRPLTQPVPATLAGVLSQDLDFIMQVMMAWMQALVGVAAPLVKPSTSGKSSVEASIPMEPL